MIKLDAKDPARVPDSIKIPNHQNQPRTGATTHARRMEVIAAGSFDKNNKTYTDRYKQIDLKRELGIRQNHKCCYCESDISSRSDVEHWRPTSLYPWLAYSWDNLLLACQTCNQDFKKDEFPIGEGRTRAVFGIEDIEQIHCLCESYNEFERPLLLHPEMDDAQSLITFTIDGNIHSENARAAETIRICGLKRDELKAKRLKILKSFAEKVRDRLFRFQNEAELEKHLQVLVKDFEREAEDNEKEFTAFRAFSFKAFLPIILEHPTIL